MHFRIWLTPVCCLSVSLYRYVTVGAVYDREAGPIIPTDFFFDFIPFRSRPCESHIREACAVREWNQKQSEKSFLHARKVLLPKQKVCS